LDFNYYTPPVPSYSTILSGHLATTNYNQNNKEPINYYSPQLADPQYQSPTTEVSYFHSPASSIKEVFTTDKQEHEIKSLQDSKYF
jgi:hypothetical protein